MTSQEIISALEQLNLEEIEESHIVKLMEQFGRAGGIITTVHPAYNKDQIPSLFVRATNYDPAKETISSIERLKYPPLEYNTSYQRASTPSRPMFYAVRHKTNEQPDVMSAIRTCLLETIDNYDDLVNGKFRVAISLRYNDVPINLYSIFNWTEFQSDNPEMYDISQSFQDMIKHNEPEVMHDTKVLIEYLAKRFSIPVGKDEYNYMPSAVITQYLMDKLSAYGIDGVIFPSTKANRNELNIAMNPSASNEKLYVTKVLDCEYKQGGIVEIQKRADIKPDNEEVIFTENVNIPIDLNE